MKKSLNAGPFLFALAITAFGAIQLWYQHFLITLLPFPESIPFYPFWVYLTAVIMLTTSVLILFNIKRAEAAAITGVLFFIFFLILHVPKLLGTLKDPLEWTVAFETLFVGSGGFIISAQALPKTTGTTKLKRTIISISPLCRYLIALSLIVFGILHIRYTSFIQKMIPAWMPAHLILAGIVIFGLFLAALSFILHVQVRLASTLLGILFFLWVVLIHIPAVMNNMNAEAEWIALFIALACSGTSFAMAEAEPRHI